MIEKRHTVRKYLNQPLNIDLVEFVECIVLNKIMNCMI